TRGVIAGSWYDLVARAFAHAPKVDFHFDDWAGKGWRIERHGSPREPAETPVPRLYEVKELPEWALRAPRREVPPPRPLAPSKPPEDEPPVRSPFADETRFRRGRLVHRLLETLPDLPPASRPAAARRYLARPGLGLAPDEIDDIAAETLALFEDPAA